MKMNNKTNCDERSGDVPRRDFLKNTMLSVGLAAGAAAILPFALYGQNKMMNKYGLFGKLQAKAGQGKKLSELLMKDADTLKGCILYVVSRDAANPDAIYVMEVWESKEDHDNSLKLPAVRELITLALPLLDDKPAGGTTLEVLGGKGV
jgi:quinol monooxygenase YgiN